MILLPTFQTLSANYFYNILLDGQICKLEFIYNIRNERFHMSFTDAEGGNVSGIKIVENFPLLKYHKANIQLDGDIILTLQQNIYTPVTYNNFGTTWKLYYYNVDELADWEEANGI